jgi:hypothetical protein
MEENKVKKDLEKMISDWGEGYSRSRRVVYPSPDGRKFEIVLNGVKATGILLDKAAPKTCNALWERLPIKGYAIHAAWSGEICRFLEAIDFQITKHENAMCHGAPGNIFYDINDKELGVAYGLHEFRMPTGSVSITICGMITENFDEFAKMCSRIRLQGALEMEIRKAE